MPAKTQCCTSKLISNCGSTIAASTRMAAAANRRSARYNPWPAMPQCYSRQGVSLPLNAKVKSLTLNTCHDAETDGVWSDRCPERVSVPAYRCR